MDVELIHLHVNMRFYSIGSPSIWMIVVNSYLIDYLGQQEKIFSHLRMIDIMKIFLQLQYDYIL